MRRTHPLRRLGWLYTRATALAAIATLAFALPAAHAARPAMPRLQLAQPLNGQAAIRALSTHLPAVAAHYGMSPQKLTEILAQDHSAWLDQHGRLFFVDDAPRQQRAGSAGSTSPASAAPYALEQTFALHSRPGATRLIYLDFNGHAASNTAWSKRTINAPAFDLDGQPGSFSDAEKERIQAIWQRVAEDYAPFDVNVTTAEPAADALRRTSINDSQFGTRVVVTHSSVRVCSSCGGVAYVGVFNYYSSSNPDYYQPAWVLYDALGHDEKNIAEAISHEAGHNLGLSHDGATSTSYYQGHGSGATGWAPIMGVGYYRELVQWSRGEYPGANNTEDDIAVMQSFGAPLRSDDMGSTPATATPLSGSSNGSTVSINQTGVLERDTDVDLFGFVSAAGPLSVSLAPAPRSPNLDASLTLLNSAGTVLASANDPDGLGASLNVNLSGGSYMLRIGGVGDADPAPGYGDYGSLGQYHISGSYADSGALPPIARAEANPLSGTAPLEVSFSGSASSDPDGSITAYAWNFGDGGSASQANPLHRYETAGSYSATLTVTDAQGLQASDTLQITVSPNPAANSLHVQDITLSLSGNSRSGYQCKASVSVHSGGGLPLAGAVVGGAWSGVVSSTGSATTSSSGVAQFTMPKTRQRGTCTFSVNTVQLPGYSYEPSQNTESSDSLSY